MHVRVCVALLCAIALGYVHASKVVEQEPDVKKEVVAEARSDGKVEVKVLNGRDGGEGGGENEEEHGSVDSGWKNDDVKKVEIIEYDNSNKHDRGHKSGGKRNDDGWKDDGWKGDNRKISIGWQSEGKVIDSENKNEKREYVGSSSNKNEAYDKNDGDYKQVEVSPYEKHEKNAYEKNDGEKKNAYEKNEKNAYVKKEEPKSDYGKAAKFSGYADVIASPQNLYTLDQIYRPQKNEYGAEYHNNQYNNNPYGQRQLNNQQQILLLLKHGRDFASWDPRNNNSQWEFVGTKDGAPADNAAYVVHSGYEEGNHVEQWQNDNKNSYAPAYNHNDGAKKDKSYVVQYSLPFKQYYTSTDPNNKYDYYEGAVQSKTNYTVGPTQRLLVRQKMACKIINADKNPFPASQVSNPWDDPRLANCFLQLIDNDGFGLTFFLAVTNTGVWANYERNSGNNSTAQSFAAKRRVGRRQRYDTLVDAAIEYDRRQGVVNYYLNGYRVWSIYAIGVIPPDDGVTNIDRGQGDPQVVQPTSLKVAFGTGKCLDESDPNVPSQRTRLVRVLGNSTYYSTNDTFYDENNLKSSQLWGEGAILTLLKLLVLRAESIIFPQQTLPGVYGSEKYHPYSG